MTTATTTRSPAATKESTGGNSPSPVTLTFEVVDPPELLANPDLDNINKLIIEAYQAWGHPRFPDDPRATFSCGRLEHREELAEELASGRLVIVRDLALQPTTAKRPPGKFTLAGRYGQVVGVAGVKPWTGRVVAKFNRARAQDPLDGEKSDAALGGLTAEEEEAEYARTWNWEISACTVVDDQRYRGTGLASRAVAVLTTDLLERRQGRVLRLWTTAKMGTKNDEYWARRGFKAVALDNAPAGVWGSLVPQQILTMSKVIE